MKSTSVARQAIMHDVCNAPYVADCPTDECGKCRFNGLKPKDTYVQTCFLPKGEDCKGGACDECRWYKNSEEYKKEHQSTNQQTNKERKMNLEEAMKNPDKLARQSAEGAYDAVLHVAEVMTRTYGAELNDDQKLHAVSAIEAACKVYLDAKACEKVIVNSESWCQEASEAEEALDPRYSGEAMLKDDIVRHSMYDLSGAKFNVGPVDFAGYLESIDPSEDNVLTWRARAVFTVGDYDVQFWFEFDEKGSAIKNSVKAFDRMVHNGFLHACFDYKPVPEDMGACKGGSNE